MPVTEEVGKAAGTFMDIMRTNPLSLALVVMNTILLGYLLYSGIITLRQRKETVELIIKWQQNSDKLIASCVSKDILDTVIRAFERDREVYHKAIPRASEQGK